MNPMLDSRRYVLNGVLNGIDTEEWDPAKDPFIAKNYTVGDFSRGKAACKAALQEELGLPVDPNV